LIHFYKRSEQVATTTEDSDHSDNEESISHFLSSGNK